MFIPPNGRAALRFAAVYVTGWLPVVAIYAAAVTVMTQGAMSPADALIAALANLAVPAAMGVAIWLAVPRLPWPATPVRRFAIVHATGALAFTAAWMGWELLLLGPTGPVRPPTYEIWRYVLPWQSLIGLVLYGVITGVAYAAQGAAHGRDLQLAAERAERLRAQAELSALRAHVNPHFLFNTLHAVMQLLRSDPARAESALEQLADLFSYVLRLERQRTEVVTIDDDWRFAANYLALEQLRLGERLAVSAALDDEALSCAVPPFTIQPLVENAVRHGIVPKRGPGTIRVSADEADGLVRIVVADDGIGAEPERPSGDPGLGERAVARRLAARFGDAATTRVETAPGAGYRVTLTFPAEVVAPQRGAAA